MAQPTKDANGYDGTNEAVARTQHVHGAGYMLTFQAVGSMTGTNLF